MRNTIVLGIISLFIVGGVVFINMNPGKGVVPVGNISPTPTGVKKEATRTIMMSEVAKHNLPENCWVVVSGKVYDLTSFIAQGQHPPVITEHCGKDGTAAFNMRGEKKSPHPEQAHQVLTTLYRGELGK